MKVISMVPSWTETLLEAGVNVVGRTGYCIEPKPLVKDIPIVGGTKNIHWKKVSALNPDLMVLDKEENPKSMAKDSPYELLISHIQSVDDVPIYLKEFGQKLSNRHLSKWAEDWQQIINNKSYWEKPLVLGANVVNIPGVVEWISPSLKEVKTVLYMIWREPWMAVSSDTFIGSMLRLQGIDLPNFANKYPQINLEEYKKEETLLLLSTEPYDFVKEKEEFKKMGFPCAIIDGRSYSWFGLHALNFLKQTTLYTT